MHNLSVRNQILLIALLIGVFSSAPTVLHAQNGVMSQLEVTPAQVVANTPVTVKVTVDIPPGCCYFGESASITTRQNVGHGSIGWAPRQGPPPDYAYIVGTFDFSSSLHVGCAQDVPTQVSVDLTHQWTIQKLTTQITVLPPALSLTVEPIGDVASDGVNVWQAKLTMDPAPAEGYNSYDLLVSSDPPGLLSSPLVYPYIHIDSSGPATFYVYSSRVTEPTSATLKVTPAAGVTYTYDGTTVRASDDPPPVDLCGTATAPVIIYPPPPDARAEDLGCNCKKVAKVGTPINTVNGNTFIQQTDLQLPGLGGGLKLTRTWNSLFERLAGFSYGWFGRGWMTDYDEYLSIRGSTVRYYRPDGSVIFFNRDSLNNVYVLSSPADAGASLTYDSNDERFTITFHNGIRSVFGSDGYPVAFVDRNENATSLSYDSYSGALATIQAPSGHILTFHYDNPRNSYLITSITTDAGTSYGYHYDSNGNLIQVDYPDHASIHYEYDTNDQLTAVKDDEGKILEAHTYDRYRRGLSSVRANGVDQVTVSYAQDGTAQITNSVGGLTDIGSALVGGHQQVISTAGNGCSSCGAQGANSFTYFPDGRTESSTDELGHTTNFTYDSDGNQASQSQTVDNVQQTSSYTYNTLGEVLTATDPLGNVTTNTYDVHGNLLTTTAPSLDGTAPGPVTTFAYDDKGQLLTVTDPRNKVTTMTYTATGLVHTIEDPLHNVTTFEYDARGNRTGVLDAASHQVTYTYDAMNRLTRVTRPDTTHSDFAYDTRGRRTSVTDANGKVTTYTYDDADRLTSVTDANNGVMQYAFDTENSLTSTKDALNRETKYEYNSKHQLSKTIFPSQLFETYTYDILGKLLTKTDRKGQTVTYTYDGIDRLKSKSYSDSTGVEYAYDLGNRLTQVTDLGGTYSFRYDNLGRQTLATTQYSFLPGRTLRVESQYDAGSNRTRMTNAESESWSYGYDDASRLTQITDPASQQFSFTFDILGRRTLLNRPAGANSFDTTYEYDSLSRLTAIHHGSAMNFGYGYDAVGNRVSETYAYSSTVTGPYLSDGIGGTGSAGGSRPAAGGNGTATTAGFAWDNQQLLNRIVHANQTNVVLQPDNSGRLTVDPSNKLSYTFSVSGDVARYDYTQTKTTNYGYDNTYQLITAGKNSYSYDLVGNRTSGSNRYNNSNQLISAGSATYTYDANGNVLTRTVGTVVTTYTWDFENQLTSVSVTGGPTTTFKYDPLGRRIEKNNEIYVYDGANLIEMLNAAGTVQSKYTFGLGVDEVLANGDNFYYRDGLGSVRMLANKSDAHNMVLYTYDAFGNTTVGGKNPGLADRFRYTGREYDQETGIYFYRARYYDPSNGRFLNEDLLLSSDTPNRYLYALNNPARLRDPSGHQEEGAEEEEAEEVIEERERELEALRPVEPNVEPETKTDTVFRRHTPSDVRAVEKGACSIDPELEEAIRINEAFNRIRNRGPFPHSRDGIIFHNREGHLPPQPDGYYREYTVEDPSVSNRGARRIVVGDGGEFFYTDSHYQPSGGQPPFTRIK